MYTPKVQWISWDSQFKTRLLEKLNTTTNVIYTSFQLNSLPISPDHPTKTIILHRNTNTICVVVPGPSRCVVGSEIDVNPGCLDTIAQSAQVGFSVALVDYVNEKPYRIQLTNNSGRPLQLESPIEVLPSTRVYSILQDMFGDDWVVFELSADGESICEDIPIVLYYKSNISVDVKHIINRRPHTLFDRDDIETFLHEPIITTLLTDQDVHTWNIPRVNLLTNNGEQILAICNSTKPSKIN